MGKRKVQVDSDDELAAEVSEDYEEEVGLRFGCWCVLCALRLMWRHSGVFWGLCGLKQCAGWCLGVENNTTRQATG